MRALGVLGEQCSRDDDRKFSGKSGKEDERKPDAEDRNHGVLVRLQSRWCKPTTQDGREVCIHAVSSRSLGRQEGLPGYGIGRAYGSYEGAASLTAS